MKSAFFIPSVLALALASIGALAGDCNGNAPVASQAGATPQSQVIYVNPLADFAHMQAMLERQFSALNTLNAMNGFWASAPVMFSPIWDGPMPAANMRTSAMQRTKDGYQLQISLPGFKPEDIHVHLDGRLLNISAQSFAADNVKTGSSPEPAESSRSVSEMMTLPGPVQAGAIKQSFENGVLTITLPSATPTAAPGGLTGKFQS